ncbi:MAG TPA: hypothetical protein VJQ52_23055 [Steroidobacteraceae bacterium]|nr:hypothetical protein [Steroidobacteraceae bacterium]
MQRPTVFLHGGWRCGSTYIWNKFRARDDVLAFYEPFNERLARCTPAAILADTPHTWDSRHPQLAAPYFAEYLPLINGRGVARYEDRFAVRRYFVPTQQPLAEAAYLASLVRLAEDVGKQAVLGFSRSLGRVGAIKRIFGGSHVVLTRDPVQQWLSTRAQRVKRGNPYFEIGHLMILALAPRLSIAGRIAHWLRIPHLRFGSFGHHYRLLRRRFEPLDDELSCRAFTAVYMLSYMKALRHADVVVDVDRLSHSRSYRTILSSALRHATGVELDFADCKLPAHHAIDASVDVAAIQREVAERIRMEQPDAQPELVYGMDYAGFTSTAAPRLE